MKSQDVVVDAAKKRGIDEVLVISSGKLELREWVGHRAVLRGGAALPIDRARALVREYGQCALLIGKEVAGFAEALVQIEQELHKQGFYKAWAIVNAPQAGLASHEWFNIDIIMTLRRYKKNLAAPQPGEYPPWAIMLLE